MRNILLDVRHFPWLYKAEFVAGLLLQLLGILQILLLLLELFLFIRQPVHVLLYLMLLHFQLSKVITLDA